MIARGVRGLLNGGLNVRRINAWIDRVGSAFGSVREKEEENDQPDLSRRKVFTGVAALAAGALLVTTLPGPAAAQIEFHIGPDDDDDDDWDRDDDDDDDHGRRRSRNDHGRRRSRDRHSRRRSRDHGRRRSRREFENWNDDCVPTPFGWFCF